MRAQDIELLVQLSAPAVHPSGEWAVVASSRPSIEANRQVGQLWRVSLADGTRTRLTQGVADAAPTLTPDGSRVLFLRADANDTTQVWVMPSDGGEPVQATAHPGGVTGFDVSPDGERIAFTALEIEHGRLGTVEGVAASQESPRRITEHRYLGNGVGYVRDRRSHVLVSPLPAAGGEPVYARAAAPTDERGDVREPAAKAPEATRLTHGDFDHGHARWTTDGAHVLAITARHDTREDDLRSSIVELDPTTPDAEPHTVVASSADLSIGAIEALPGGGYALLAQAVGESGRDFVARSTSLVLVDGPGAEPRIVTDDETVDLGEVGSHLTLTADGILAQQRMRGRVQLVRIDDRVEQLTSGDVEVLGHGVAGDVIVVAIATPTSFGEVAVVDAAAPGGLRVLTDFGAPLAEAGVTAPVELEVQARDAASSVHGWVWVPEGEGPHPVLLNIHGGPFAQYGVHVFDEAQVAVDAGYAVVQCNPRGSAGYGREHGVAIKERMGTVDLTDVLDFLDGALAAHPELDGGRVGVMGGSYGGYLTAWTIAHDHRFTAAIVERGYLDPLTFVGTSDIGWFFSDEYTGVDEQAVLAQSPMAHVGDVRTPTLVVHSERDLRCPLEQAQRYFAALRRNGVETEMLVFPGEDHELTRSGQPRHRIERFEHVLEWWARHLPTERNHVRG